MEVILDRNKKSDRQVSALFTIRASFSDRIRSNFPAQKQLCQLLFGVGLGIDL